MALTNVIAASLIEEAERNGQPVDPHWLDSSGRPSGERPEVAGSFLPVEEYPGNVGEL